MDADTDSFVTVVFDKLWLAVTGDVDKPPNLAKSLATCFF